MQYLLLSLRGREKDRSTAFTTTGLIAVAVEDDIKPYLPRIMDVIRVSLPAKVRFVLIFTLQLGIKTDVQAIMVVILSKVS
jgi:hypothetical protein